MKTLQRLLIIALCLLIPSSAMTWGLGVMSGGVASVGGECTGLLVCQNFETATTGYDNTSNETWTPSADTHGVISPAYTTNPLRGSQSLLITQATDGDSSSVSATFTAQSHIHGFFIVAAANPSDNVDILKIQNSSNVNVMKIAWRDNGIIGLNVGGGDDERTETAPGSPLYIWFDYTKGTGANAIAHLYISTTKTKPAATLTITAGTSVTDASKIVLESSYSTGGFKFDQIMISTDEFTPGA